MALSKDEMQLLKRFALHCGRIALTNKEDGAIGKLEEETLVMPDQRLGFHHVTDIGIARAIVDGGVEFLDVCKAHASFKASYHPELDMIQNSLKNPDLVNAVYRTRMKVIIKDGLYDQNGIFLSPRSMSEAAKWNNKSLFALIEDDRFTLENLLALLGAPQLKSMVKNKGELRSYLEMAERML